mmetsp:Transcript_16913/g.40193  ORF Transcript_16913/g.40193 Transcript_16913/m.40193 type:complete len:240 (+) Transcript_16913:7988-8707(+)
MAVGAGGPLRRHAALHPAGDGDPVVLPADPQAAGAAGRADVCLHHLHTVRGLLLLRDHARGHPVGVQGPGPCRLCAGHDLRPEHAPGRAAAGLPEYASGAADPDHHPVPGHLAGLCGRRVRPAQGLRGRGQELQPPGRNLSGRRRRLLRHLLRPVAPCARAAKEDRHHSIRIRRDRHQKRLQVVRQLPGADRLHHLHPQGRGRRRLRALGLGQIDADQDRQCAGALPEGRHRRRRHLHR